MALTGSIAKNDDETITEVAGEIVAAHSVWVVGVTQTPWIFKALSHADLPQPGQRLNADNPDVRVFGRKAHVIVWDNTVGKATVEVEIDYKIQRSEPDARFPVQGGSTLNQIQTQRHNPRVGPFFNDDPIRVSYGDPLDVQTVKATVMEPLGHFAVDIREETETPDKLVQDWIGLTNLDT